ncbi:MAG: DPP IV N-terminal domain-containing protein [Gammaproteobacteria bacterium]
MGDTGSPARSPAAVFKQLGRKRLVQWAIAYLAAAWVALQVAELIADIFGLSDYLLRAFTVALGFGFLAALVLAWYHGERGEQRLKGAELALLVAILVVAGFVVRTIEVEEAGVAATQASVFASMDTRQLTATTTPETNPAWSPDGSSIVYVSAEPGNQDLWIQNLEDSGMRQLTDDPAEDDQPAWSPDGRHIAFVSSRGHGQKLDRSTFFGYSLGGGVFVVPAFGGEARELVDGGFNPTWSPDSGEIAFDADLDGPRRIWITDLVGNNPRRISDDSSDLAVHTRADWSRNGDWIVYERQEGSQGSAGNLQLVSAAGGESIWLTQDDNRDFAPTWVDDTTIVFSSDRGGDAINLWQLSIDPEAGHAIGEPTRITAGAGDDIDPAVSNDGRLVYSTIRRFNNLWRIGLDPDGWIVASDAERLMNAAWNDFAPALSADGSTLVFVSDREGNRDLWRLDIGNQRPVQITSGSSQDDQPDWSPDGNHIAFFSDRNGNNDIWIVPADGGTPIAVTNDRAGDTNPYWSPDGQSIAFMSDRSGQSDLWIMDADGSHPRQLTSIGATAHTARWSPDGNWIVFTSIKDGVRDTWIVSADGAQIRQITRGETQDAHGLWSPDSEQVLYLSGHRELYVAPIDPDQPARLVYAPGQRIDYPHVSPDGRTLFFTLVRVDGDLWTIE